MKVQCFSSNFDDKLFYLAFSLVIIYILFLHSNLFFCLSYIIMFFLFVKNLKNVKLLFLKDQKKDFLILFLFLYFIFFSIFFSLNPFYSLKFFFENYVFHIILFIMLALWISKNLQKIKILFHIHLFISLSYIIILSFYIFLFCKIEFYCAFRVLNDSLFYKKTFLRNPLIIIQSAIIMTFIFSLVLYFIEKKFIKFLYLVFSCFILTLILLLSRRAILLGLILGTLLIFIYVLLQKSLNNKLKIQLMIWLLLFLSLNGFLIFSERTREHFIARDKLLIAGKLVCDKLKAGSMGLRICSWVSQIKFLTQNNPFKGSGIGRIVQKEYLIQHNLDPMGIGNPHNTYINIWMQAGLQTLFLFLFFLVITFKKSISLIKSKNFIIQILGIYFSIGWLSFVILMFFFGIEEGPRFTSFWITAGMIWGCYASEKYEKLS